MTNLLLNTLNEILKELDEVSYSLVLASIEAIELFYSKAAISFTRPGYVTDLKLYLIKSHVDGSRTGSTTYNTVGIIVPHIPVYEESCRTEISFLTIQEYPYVNGGFS